MCLRGFWAIIHNRRLLTSLTSHLQEPTESLSRLNVNSKSQRQKSTTQKAMENHRNFLSMGISESLVASLNSMSIRRPTTVQMACIPPLLEGKPFPVRLDQFSQLFKCCGRKRLHRQRQNWLRKNHSIRTSYSSKIIARSIWHFCPGSDAYSVSRSTLKCPLT